MDAFANPQPEMAGYAIIFSGYELDECRDRRGFHLGRLRRFQLEKGLQVILREYHGIAVRYLDEVCQHVTVIGDLSLVKMKRVHPVRYLMTIKYRYQNRAWEHVFRYERNTTAGGISVSGRLHTHARRQISAK